MVVVIYCIILRDQQVMADTAFLRKLQEYPKDTINGEIIDLLVPYFGYPLYTFESAKQACGNVAGLIQWTMAMASFYEVNKEVLPLKVSSEKVAQILNCSK